MADDLEVAALIEAHELNVDDPDFGVVPTCQCGAQRWVVRERDLCEHYRVLYMEAETPATSESSWEPLGKPSGDEVMVCVNGHEPTDESVIEKLWDLFASSAWGVSTVTTEDMEATIDD